MDENSAPDPVSELYTSSKNLDEKLQLPLRSTFCLPHEEKYVSGDVVVRRDSGLLKKLSKTKMKFCVLLKTGRLLIYSGVDRGLNLNILEVSLKKQAYSEKMLDNNETKARFEVSISYAGQKLALLFKGTRSEVIRWRKGLLRANQGLELSELTPLDELTWSQQDVDPMLSHSMMSSLASRTLRHNQSMPALPIFNSSTISRKSSSAKRDSSNVVRAHTMKTPSTNSGKRMTLLPSLFNRNIPEDVRSFHHEESPQPSPRLAEPFLVTAVVEPLKCVYEGRDSGVCSPISEEDEIKVDEKEFETSRNIFDGSENNTPTTTVLCYESYGTGKYPSAEKTHDISNELLLNSTDGTSENTTSTVLTNTLPLGKEETVVHWRDPPPTPVDWREGTIGPTLPMLQESLVNWNALLPPVPPSPELQLLEYPKKFHYNQDFDL